MKTNLSRLHVIVILAAAGCLAIPVSAQNSALYVDDVIEEEVLPAPEPELYTQATNSSGEPEPEVIRQRHDNRRVKLEREVVQDEDQNYINHGKWKMWDQQGNVLVEGRYKYNVREGVWTKIYRQRDAKLLSIAAPFDQGRLPLVSQANFRDGKLNGKWVIYDANKRKLSEWEFTDGRRHGRSTWWYAKGTKMREINYDDGSIDGEFNEWDRAGQQVTNDRYEDGRRLEKKTEYHRGHKKSEGMILYPRYVLETADDWWNCTLATYTQEGEAEKHGTWISWYPNGQRKLEGHYKHDIPTGEFVWWHPNGQKSLQAAYQDGKKHGNWTWWHANGQKSIQGEYVNGDPSSKWLWWKDTGKVAQRADFSDPNQQGILAMPSNIEGSSPSASKTTLGRSLK